MLIGVTSYFNPIPENIGFIYLLSYFSNFHGQQPNFIGVIFLDGGTKIWAKKSFSLSG
jgi:Na+/melibiose symporter-like transporter